MRKEVEQGVRQAPTWKILRVGLVLSEELQGPTSKSIVYVKCSILLIRTPSNPSPIPQVVVLGAGYDMRGARLGLGDAGVKVFEAPIFHRSAGRVADASRAFVTWRNSTFVKGKLTKGLKSDLKASNKCFFSMFELHVSNEKTLVV